MTTSAMDILQTLQSQHACREYVLQSQEPSMTEPAGTSYMQ